MRSDEEAVCDLRFMEALDVFEEEIAGVLPVMRSVGKSEEGKPLQTKVT